MAIQPSDLSDDFVRSGKRLITQPSADRLLNRVKANAGKSLKAKISPASPTDRWSLCSSMDAEQSALAWTRWDAEPSPSQGCFAKAHIVCSLSHRSDRIDASVDSVRAQVFAYCWTTQAFSSDLSYLKIFKWFWAFAFRMSKLKKVSWTMCDASFAVYFCWYLLLALFCSRALINRQLLLLTLQSTEVRSMKIKFQSLSLKAFLKLQLHLALWRFGLLITKVWMK